MAIWTLLLSTALVIGCGDKGKTGDDTATDGGADGGADGGSDGGGDTGSPVVPDNDGDGSLHGVDCDDDISVVDPGATEICNGIDDNCDGVIDTDAVDAELMYADRDGDGYGNPLDTVSACPGAEPDGYVTNNLDCRDSDRDINPDGREVCDEQNLDENCNGLREDADPGADPLSMTTWYADYDLDGFGDPTTLVQGCDVGGIRSLNHLDCDDGNAAVGPDSSCAPFDGVWSGAADFSVHGIYGYSGSCDDSGSVTVSDASSNQVSGTLVCNWYTYGYPVTLTLYGTIDYPWGVSGYWTDAQSWFFVDPDWQTSFTGTFSADGSSLDLVLTGSRNNLFGSYDVSLDGTWALTH